MLSEWPLPFPISFRWAVGGFHIMLFPASLKTFASTMWRLVSSNLETQFFSMRFCADTILRAWPIRTQCTRQKMWFFYKAFAHMILARVEQAWESFQPEVKHGFRSGRRMEKHLLRRNMILDKSRALCCTWAARFKSRFGNPLLGIDLGDDMLHLLDLRFADDIPPILPNNEERGAEFSG